jgi:hypothetical protein
MRKINQANSVFLRTLSSRLGSRSGTARVAWRWLLWIWWRLWNRIFNQPANHALRILNTRYRHSNVHKHSENRHKRPETCSRIGRQVGQIQNGVKYKPNRLHPKEKNGKLPECHLLPKSLFFGRNNVSTNRLWRRADKCRGATHLTACRIIRILSAAISTNFHKSLNTPNMVL